MILQRQKAVTETPSRASENGNSTGAGIATKDLKLRLPRVYGRVNVKRTKVVIFKKKQESGKERKHLRQRRRREARRGT